MLVILVVLLFAIIQLLLWRFVTRNFNDLFFFHSRSANGHAVVDVGAEGLVRTLFDSSHHILPNSEFETRADEREAGADV